MLGTLHAPPPQSAQSVPLVVVLAERASTLKRRRARVGAAELSGIHYRHRPVHPMQNAIRWRC